MERVLAVTMGKTKFSAFTEKGGKISGYHDGRLEFLQSFNAEGALVVDFGDILSENPALIIKSPLLSIRLGPNAVDRFIKNADESKEYGPFDYVGKDIFAEWWRKHGARIGVIVGNGIRWEDGYDGDCQDSR